MTENLHLTTVLQLRLLKPPTVLPADMAQVIVGQTGPRGVPGPPGSATTVPVGPDAISGHSAVACGPDGLLIPADCTTSTHLGAVLGLVADAYSPGEDAVVQTGFVLEHAGWSWTPGPVFVGLAGQLTQALPPAAIFSQVVGHALSATRVLVDLQPPIHIT